jgi:hypothetical protein
MVSTVHFLAVGNCAIPAVAAVLVYRGIGTCVESGLQVRFKNASLHSPGYMLIQWAYNRYS